MHKLNSRILFHSSFSHILFLPALPHPNIICKAFRAFHPVCFHCVLLDESQVPDSHLFSCAERSVAPLFYEYNSPFSWTSESFPKLLGKIHISQGANVSIIIKSTLPTQIQAWTFQVTLFKINQHLLKIWIVLKIWFQLQTSLSTCGLTVALTM